VPVDDLSSATLSAPQFKDVDKGDRIRLTVDKGGARLVEDS
jgi:hypothetical protein